MAIDIDDIEDFIHQMGRGILHYQVNAQARELDTVFKSKKLTGGSSGVVEVMENNGFNGGVVTDGQTMPARGSSTPRRGQYLPGQVHTSLQFGFAALHTMGEAAQGSDVVEGNLMEAAKQGARLLSRLLVDNESIVCNATNIPTLPTTTAGTTLVAASPGIWREGQLYDIRAAGVLEEVVRCVAVAWDPQAGVANVTIVRNLTAFGSPGTHTWATTDTLSLFGSQAADVPLVSVSELAASSGTQYGITATSTWQGNQNDLAGAAISEADLVDMRDQIEIRCGESADFILAGPTAHSRIGQLLVGQRRFSGTDTLQAGRPELQFDGVTVLRSTNMDNNKILFVNSDYCKMHEFRELGFSAEGSIGKGGPARGRYAHRSETVNSYYVNMDGLYNVYCNKRSALGKILNVGS